MPLTKANDFVFDPVVATGSNTPRTLSDRFSDVINVKDFGAIGNGIADDTAAIQAAINFCASRNGGYVNIPSGTYNLTNPIEITSSNIKIEGEGGDYLHDGGTGALPATKIVYAGSTSAASLFYIYTPIGTSNAKRFGSGIRNIFIECNDKIANAIHIKSVNGGNFENITIYNPTFAGVLISNWNAGSIAEAADSQLNIFTNVSVRCIDILSRPNVNGFILDSGPAGPGPLSGANTSFNSFQYCQVQCRDGSAFLFIDADNNNFNQCRAFVVGTGKGLDIRGADSNYFYGFSCGGFPSKLWIRGTASGFFQNPVGNAFIYPDQGNGTTYPNLDAGCKVGWIGAAVTVKDRTAQQVISDSPIIANNLIDSIGNVSLLIDNASQNALKFTNSGNANPYWAINYNGVDLRINTTEPTGEINLGNGAKTKSGTIYPSVDNSFTLGTTTGGNKVWSNIYSQNPVTVVSDEREKKEISQSVLGLDFIKSLNPVSYKFKVGQKNITKYDENLNPIEFEEIEGTRTHFGLLSQEVKAALPEGVDFGGWVLTDKENPDSQQALRYDQFIAPLIKAVQEQQKQIEELSAEVAALKPK